MNNKNVYIVTSYIANRFNVEAAFSTYEYAERFCEVENSKIEDYRKQDEGYFVKPHKVDIRKVPENQCYKKYWDFAVIIDKDVQEYGKINYAGTDKELVHINKLQDVEIYEDEVIYCRSYISKVEAQKICEEQWQMWEQKLALKKEDAK